MLDYGSSPVVDLVAFPDPRLVVARRSFSFWCPVVVKESIDLGLFPCFVLADRKS
jgi:hypothetical protein